MYSVFLFLFLFITSTDSLFEIFETKHNVYHAGVRDGGIGANYQITVIAKKSSDKLQFLDIYTDCDTLKIDKYDTRFNSISSFSKGDTLVLKASDFIKIKSEGNCLNNPEIQLNLKYKKKSFTLPIKLNSSDKIYGV